MISPMVQWYYGKAGSPEGPVEETVFRERISAGVIGEDTLVWKRGMPEWQKLSSLPEWAELQKKPLPDVFEDVPPLPAPVMEKKSHIPPPREKSQNPYASSASVRRASIPQARYGQPAGATSSSAIASLVCGILGVTFCALTTIPAIICGHQALAEIRQSGGRIKGRGMAQAGMALGYVGIVLIGVAIIGFLLSASFH